MVGPAEADDCAPGDFIAGRFRVERPLGRGGAAAVYEVSDRAGCRLALKRMQRADGRGEIHRLAFRREFHTMAHLEHPCIVEVYDYGLDGDRPYYTMELVQGADLRRLAPMEPQRAGFVLREVASALAYLHSRRLLHRDLAPANVRATDDGRTKLLDFGTLASPGTRVALAGTPPVTAPESVQRMPLDHRADLYGLGALAYWLLTGRHAYPARSFEALEALWSEPPAPPSTFFPECSAALDELVMSLLSLDPLARPKTAGEVMDRLGGILALEPAPELEVARSYLANTALVGRLREVRKIRQQVVQLGRGEGGVILLEGPSGIGKSRLLREAQLEAQLAGATAVATSGDDLSHGVYGSLASLLEGLAAVAPDELAQAVSSVGPTARRALSAVAPGVSTSSGAATAAEGRALDRIALQRTLCQVLLETARGRRLVFLVDDLQRFDEASFAVLVAVARAGAGHAVLLVAGVRTDERPRAPVPLAALRDAALRLRLHGLSQSDAERLVEVVFGASPRGERLAHWLFRVTGGNPLHMTEVPRQLVERGVIRYIDGVWSIDERFEESDLPRVLGEALEARLDALSPGARALAETLSVRGAEVPLDLAVALGERDEPAIFEALAELVRADILDVEGEAYRFRHDGLREALLRTIDSERRRALHLRVGRALRNRVACELDAGEHREEMGWHLFLGGDEELGAELLERVGRRLFAAQAFADCVAPLETALTARHGVDHDDRHHLELRSMLLIAGGMADREVALRYAEKTLHAYRRYGGVALAERAGRFVGRRVGFFLGLLGACARWAVSPRRRHSLSPVAALRELFKAVASTASSASTTWSVEQMEALADLVAPAVVSSRRVSYGTYLIARNFLEFRLGRYATLRRNAARVLSVLERDRRTPLSPIERVSAEGVARWSLAVTSAWRCDEHAAAELAQLETLDARVAALGSIQVRALHSRVRGEEEQAMAQERELELRIVQAGSGWAFRVALIYYSALIYGCCGDVVGLKRIIEELSRLSQDGFDMTMFLELARGDYHRERGELERSKEALERALELAPPAHVRDRAAVCAALAETELAGGEPDRALRHAEEAMALAEDEEVRIPAFVVRAARSLAFAHAMSGDEERAEALLARVASELSAVDCPAARGALAEAQARVAYARMRLKDLASYTEEAESYYRATANPALIARVGRMPDPLGKRRRASELPDPLIEGVTQTAVTTLGEVRSALSHSQGPVERSARVLDRLIRASSASAGYLYLWRHRGPEQTAGLPEEEPPEPLSELAESILRSGAGAPERGILPGGASWLVVPLAGAPPIGVVVLVEGGLPLEEPSEALVEELSRWLTQAGDIQAERLSSAPRLDTGTGPG